MNNKSIYTHSVLDIPKEEHYAILVPRTIHVPGDERSITNPGHGYPAYDVKCWEYLAFKDKAEWTEEIKYRHEKNMPFMPIIAHPVSVKSETKIIINEK